MTLAVTTAAPRRPASMAAIFKRWANHPSPEDYRIRGAGRARVARKTAAACSCVSAVASTRITSSPTIQTRVGIRTAFVMTSLEPSKRPTHGTYLECGTNFVSPNVTGVPPLVRCSAEYKRPVPSVESVSQRPPLRQTLRQYEMKPRATYCVANVRRFNARERNGLRNGGRNAGEQRRRRPRVHLVLGGSTRSRTTDRAIRNACGHANSSTRSRLATSPARAAAGTSVGTFNGIRHPFRPREGRMPPKCWLGDAGWGTEG